MIGKVYIFITSSDDNAKGGHFRSCLTISEALFESGVNIEIINVGKIVSPVFRSTKVPVTFYKVNWKNSLSIFSSIRKNKKITKEDRIIAFDFFSFFIIKNISFKSKSSIGYIRCGGRNPSFAPYSKTIICFSKENLEYFVSSNKFRNSRIEYLPNRVRFSQTENASSFLRDKIANDFPIILRIGRIVNNYEKVNLATIELSKYLSDNSINHNVVFIGYPDDYNSTRYADFKGKIANSSNCYHFDQPVFTKNASIFLQEAIIVIGTGRGAMEAVINNKILAIYCHGFDLPVIVENDEIFNDGFDQNFSQRVELNSTLTNNYVYQKWLEIFKNNEYQKNVISFQQSKRSHFDIKEVIEKYKEVIYNMSFDSRFNLFDYLGQFKLYIQKLLLIERVFK